MRTIPPLSRLMAVALILSVLAAAANAAPFVLVKVPSTAADKCIVSAATHAPLVAEYAVVADAHQGQRGCLIDVAGVPDGDNSITVAAKSDLWGVLGSAIPFGFVRPASGTLVIEAISLVK